MVSAEEHREGGPAERVDEAPLVVGAAEPVDRFPAGCDRLRVATVEPVRDRTAPEHASQHPFVPDLPGDRRRLLEELLGLVDPSDQPDEHARPGDEDGARTRFGGRRRSPTRVRTSQGGVEPVQPDVLVRDLPAQGGGLVDPAFLCVAGDDAVPDREALVEVPERAHGPAAALLQLRDPEAVVRIDDRQRVIDGAQRFLECGRLDGALARSARGTRACARSRRRRPPAAGGARSPTVASCRARLVRALDRVGDGEVEPLATQHARGPTSKRLADQLVREGVVDLAVALLRRRSPAPPRPPRRCRAGGRRRRR